MCYLAVCVGWHRIVCYLAVCVGGILFDHTAIAVFSFRSLDSGMIEPMTYPSPHSLATSKVNLSLGEATSI